MSATHLGVWFSRPQAPTPADAARQDHGHPTARHRAPNGATPTPGRCQTIARTVAADWSPMAPAVRQILAPGWWATRQLPAGPEERTGVLRLDDINAARGGAR